MMDEYEKQYSVLTAEITSNIGKLAIAEIRKFTSFKTFYEKSRYQIFAICFLDNRRDLIVEINRGFDESNEILEQMELEINQNTNPTHKLSQQTRLKCYFTELKRLEEEYNKSKIKPNLSSDDQDDFDLGLVEDQRRSLLDNSERLERTGLQLEDAYRVLVDTENMGAQVLSNLSQQRETIQKSRNRARETDAELGRANRIMNLMIFRSIRDNFVLYIIGAVFVIAIFSTIYFSSK